MITKLTLIVKGLIITILVLSCVLSQTFAEEFSLPELESGKVVLTWTELKTLLDEIETLKREKTREETKEEQEEKLPVDYSIAEAQLRGTVEEETVRFEADFAVHVLKNGWITFPFFQEHVGIESVRIHLADGESSAGLKSLFQDKQKASGYPAQLVRDQEGYSFLARGPAAFTAKITFHVPLKSDHLTHTLAFLPPSAVINRITLHIPGKGVNILQSEPSGRVAQTEEMTTFQAVMSKNDLLKVVWKIEKDTGIRRRSVAVIHSLASVEKSAISVSGSIVLQHLVSLEQVELRLPLNVNILNVTSVDIERWSTEQSEHTHIIRLTGQPDRRKPVELALAYRMPLPPLPAEVEIPAIQVKGIDTLDAFLGVEVRGNLEVTPGNAQNKFLIPAKNLPDILWHDTASPLLFGYEFHDNTFSATLNIKSYQELQTVVANVDLIDCVTHRTLTGKSITRVRYFIRNNDRQFLTLILPPNSRIWQAFLDGIPVKPAQKETGEVLIPMKKSAAQGEELQSFSIELGYITDVSKLSLKGDFVNELPGIDIPVSYLRWSVYLPEDYEYTNFEGPLKQVTQFSSSAIDIKSVKAQIDIPKQGKQFLFEKYLIVDETPYVRGKYGQYLGNDIFLSVQPRNMQTLEKVTPMSRYK